MIEINRVKRLRMWRRKTHSKNKVQWIEIWNRNVDILHKLKRRRREAKKNWKLNTWLCVRMWVNASIDLIKFVSHWIQFETNQWMFVCSKYLMCTIFRLLCSTVILLCFIGFWRTCLYIYMCMSVTQSVIMWVLVTRDLSKKNS